ncbi:2-C-methyl-D-erythritol 4-phosphate cytidylyltransferase [Glutamicibacter arilaitensis]|uniref:2-C-methyl-D-erythritol 4-phosphate cytidylyltransferase n=1 Tax=Glutamicibacter arilaitensis TaxID=256701 RepID=UPI00384D75F2
MSEQLEESVAVILVAAGLGTRLGAGLPKALVEVHGRSLAEHALDRILDVDAVKEVIVVVPPEDSRLPERLAYYPTQVRTVPGGNSRAASVRNGLAAVSSQITQILVHDAARAFAPVAQYELILSELRKPEVHAAIPALAVTDTISVVGATASTGSPIIIETPDRSTLRAVQTPQGFAAQTLIDAHAQLDHYSPEDLERVTDDASIVRAHGVEVHVVAGDARSLKVTHPEDLHTVGRLFTTAATKNSEHNLVIPRVGNGIDVHAVSADSSRQMWLAGLFFPEDIGLSGHSDGDAVAHAACDALFSASGIGDLGTHFGVDRPEFAGASGVSLLAEAARLVRGAGFEIGNVAVQFVARRPRFAARREEANQLLSEVLGAPVSVTATTSDGLGYEGEGAGVTAYATALVYRAAKEGQ